MKTKYFFFTVMLLTMLGFSRSAIAQNPAGLGNMLDFFGGSHDAQVTYPTSSLSPSTALTIEFWIKPTLVHSYATFVFKADGGWNNGYGVAFNNNHRKMVFFPRGWNQPRLNSTASLSAGTWYHIAVTYDGTDTRMYINGNLDASTTAITGTIPANNEILKFGHADSQMDEVRIWNIARTQADIQSKMGSYITSGDLQWGNLAAYYRFDQGDAGNDNTSLPNQVLDYSGNCNTGTLQNFTLTGPTSNWVFTGNAEAPVLTTTGASSIYGTLTTLNGNIFSIGETEVTTRGFQVSTDNCMTSPADFAETGTYTTGTYSIDASSLSPNTTYYYRSYAINSKGTSYGEVQSYITTCAPPAPAGLSNQASCGNGDVTFTVTDPGTWYTVEWSTDGSTNNDGTGLTKTKAVTVGTPVTVYARISVGVTSCKSAWSAGYTGTANALPTTPVISGNASFCPGSSTTLSIPEQPGATYCWTSSSSTWVPVGSAGFSAGVAVYEIRLVHDGHNHPVV